MTRPKVEFPGVVVIPATVTPVTVDPFAPISTIPVISQSPAVKEIFVMSPIWAVVGTFCGPKIDSMYSPKFPAAALVPLVTPFKATGFAIVAVLTENT